MKLHLFTFVLTALVLSSCGTTKNKEIMDKPDSPFSQIPTDVFWKLETLEGKDFSNFENNGREVGFTLTEADVRISGYSGCNNFFGTYKFEEGNRVKFSSLGATRMACPDNDFEENEFLKVFELADNYTINGNTLSLNVGRRAPLAVFKKVEKLNEGITEKYWKLKTLEGENVVMTKKQEREVFFMLKTQDNRVTGFAGCNTMLGTYSLEKENKIQFSKIATTMMACPETDFRESDFLKIFEIVDNYTINGDILTLNEGERTGVAVFEAVYMDQNAVVRNNIQLENNFSEIFKRETEALLNRDSSWQTYD